MIGGFSNTDWTASLREDPREVAPGKTWKTIWEKPPEPDNKNEIQLPEKEKIPVTYTFMNSGNVFNTLYSTDPKPVWKSNLDVKCQK